MGSGGYHVVFVHGDVSGPPAVTRILMQFSTCSRRSTVLRKSVRWLR